MSRIEELIGSPVLGPAEGGLVEFDGLGVRFMISGEQSGGGFSLVEHPLAPRALAAPLHRHHREDEYSYILEGSVGCQLGDRVVIGNPGDLVFKPRGQWHSFWNAGDTPARLLEIISPAGFEKYFEELTEALPANGPPNEELLGRLLEKYELDMDMASVPELVSRHGLAADPADEALAGEGS